MSLQGSSPSGDVSRTNAVKMAVGGTALALLIIFFAQNWQSVEVHIYFWTWHTHLVWALLLAAGLGVVMMLGFSTIRARRQKQHAQAIRRAA